MAAASPQLPAFVASNLIEGQARPFAEIELDQIVAQHDRNTEAVAEDLGSFARTVERARIERVDLFLAESFGYRECLGAPFGGKTDAAHSPGEDLPLQRVFTVPYQVKYRHTADPRPPMERGS